MGFMHPHSQSHATLIFPGGPCDLRSTSWIEAVILDDSLSQCLGFLCLNGCCFLECMGDYVGNVGHIIWEDIWSARGGFLGTH